MHAYALKGRPLSELYIILNDAYLLNNLLGYFRGVQKARDSMHVNVKIRQPNGIT